MSSLSIGDTTVPFDIFLLGMVIYRKIAFLGARHKKALIPNPKPSKHNSGGLACSLCFHRVVLKSHQKALVTDIPVLSLGIVFHFLCIITLRTYQTCFCMSKGTTDLVS